MRLSSGAFLSSVMFTPPQVLARGFEACVTLPSKGEYNDANVMLFKTHCGSDPIQLAHVWHDIMTSTESGITSEDMSPKGFKKFLIANYFLWVCPRNRQLLAGAFNTSVRQVEGDLLVWSLVVASQAAVAFM